jgi:nicotinate-nucleotide adenylyltransferase
MNVAIFGGTFDPVHRGHVAVARAAQAAYNLGRIYFVPADIPPHHQRQPVTPFYHRYAMLALGLRGDPTFVPSLIEAPGEEARRAPNFSIDTVRRFRSLLPKSDRLFFMIGIDAFSLVATWRQPEELLREIEFIVVSRPGYSMADIAGALPESMRQTRPLPTAATAPAGKLAKSVGATTLSVGGATLHLLTTVAEKVSSTQVRAVAASGRAAKGLLDAAVVEYIRKEHLYKAVRPKSQRSPAAAKVVSIRRTK